MLQYCGSADTGILTLQYWFWFYSIVEHGTIIRRGITCKKILCYMRDSVCRWLIVEYAGIVVCRKVVYKKLVVSRNNNAT